MALIDRITKNAQEVLIPGATVDAMAKPKPFTEIGVTGLQRTRGIGYIYEEWLPALSTHRQKQVYREMRDNDAVIGAMFFALEMILRRAEWSVEAAEGGDQAEQYAQFIHECMDDMSHTWADFIAEAINMFAFGFALFECVYKRRQGSSGKKASRFDDGLIGWRKFAPRAQESILYWIWDDEGGLQGAVQLAAPDYKTTLIPIEKLLLFRTTSQKNNPEGRSLLRNCYRSYIFKRRIEEVEGIGIERDLCGLPVLYATGEAITAVGEAQLKKLVTNIKVDDQMGVLLPQAFDEKGNPAVKLELLKTAGGKQTNASEAIKRYNEDMLNTILAGFIQFGQTEHGARSLHMSATQIFAEMVQSVMDSVAAVINRIAIPRLMALNSMDLELAPKLVPGEIGVRDLEEISRFVLNLSQAGLTFFDKDTASYLRKIARLPEEPGDTEYAHSQAVNEDAADDYKQPQNTGTNNNGKKPPVSTKPQQAATTAQDEQLAGERLQTAV